MRFTPRFRLRTLLVCGLLISIGLGLLGRRVFEARRQRAIVSSLVSQGARVKLGDNVASMPKWLDVEYLDRVTEVWSGHDPLQTKLRELSPLAELRNLDTLHLHTNARDLSPLAGLNNLKTLYLRTNAANLSPLAELSNLETLSLYTDSPDLAPLAKLSSLKELELCASGADDISWLVGLERLDTLRLATAAPDLSPLAHLERLTTLRIETVATDLSPLASLEQLVALAILAPDNASAQVQHLRDTLPNCMIYHEPKEKSRFIFRAQTNLTSSKAPSYQWRAVPTSKTGVATPK